MSKYIIAAVDKNSGGWSHLFVEGFGVSSRTIERLCRFVFDVERNYIVRLDIQIDGRWSMATPAQALDVEDSLIHSNADALDNPADYGLRSRNGLPRWCINREEKARNKPQNRGGQLPLFPYLPKVSRRV